jgi:hypothetical protein
MKTSITILFSVITMLSAMGLRAQNTNAANGVYLTEQDYKANRLSYVLSNNDKIQLNSFLGGKNVNLTYQGKKIKLAKSEIYGYRLNGQSFRFYHIETYRIIDTAGFMLYSRQILAQQGKGYKPVERSFYSVGTAQPVLELSIDNLSNSFPTEAGFRYSLNNYFSKDADLMEYDKQTDQYKIKYLYFQQKQVMASRRIK